MVKSIHGYGASEATRHNSAPDLMDPGPAVALLSNGRYSVMVTAAGAGWGTWRDLDVTRWREDVTRDCWGQFCYVRDTAHNTLWSIGKQPLARHADIYEHVFHGDRADFRCRAEEIEVSWAICVAPDADAEVRALTIVNHGKEGTNPRTDQLFRGLPEQPPSGQGTPGVCQALRGNAVRQSDGRLVCASQAARRERKTGLGGPCFVFESTGPAGGRV